MSDSSSEHLNATWTMFCVGCNERFPCGEDGTAVCPNCGFHAFNDTSDDETQMLEDDDSSSDSGVAQEREIARTNDSRDPLIGRQLHVYQCVSLIGSGGMGRVYLAIHNDLHRRCALKILSPKRSAPDADYVRRFVQEGRAAAALVHPNIVTVHAVGESDNTHFLEMEFISGRSLQQLLNDDGAFTPTRALSMASRVAEGLAAAHREGIVHRDVKPDNIMLTKQGVPKISDFGLAKRLLDSHGRPTNDGLCGTPNYMAPELFHGEPAGPATDVYALGVCLYLMLAGSLPYRAKTLAQLRWKGRGERIPNIRSLRPDVSLEVAECVALLTEETPANRPKDAIEASQLLHAVLGHERDLESLLVEAFKHETSVTWCRTGETYEMLRRFPDGRAQKVFLEPSDHGIDDRLLLFYSVCCKADTTFYEQALRLNSEMLHGSLALKEFNGSPHFVVVDTYPRSTVDPEEIRRSVLEVSRYADLVEQRLTGDDRH